MRRQELPALTSLRFFAALAIVIFHYLGSTTYFPRWIFQNLSLGVSFFYVLSGFILCYNYPAVADKAGFWLARFARVWPVHFITLIVTLAAIPFGDILGHAHWQFTLPLNFFLLQAWAPWKGSMLSFNGVSWSLSVEAYFYFVFPWLLLLFKSWGGKTLLVASFLQGLLIITVGQLFLTWPQEFGTFFPACRLFEFVLGIYTCKLWQSRDPDAPIRPLHEILSLAAGVGFVMGLGPFIWQAIQSVPVGPWFLTEVAACFFAWIIWTFAHHAGPISRILSGPLPVQLGQISFSLYMFHEIVLRFFQDHGYDVLMPPAVFFIVYVVLSMAGAYLLFYAVENPARHWIVGTYRKKTQPVEARSPAS